MKRFFKEMDRELETFEIFVDDIISSNEYLLKGELDILLMQYIFNSLELDNLENIDKATNELLVA